MFKGNVYITPPSSERSDSFHTFAEDPQDGEETDRLVGYPESLAAHSNTSSRATLKGRPDSFRYEPQPGLQDGGLYPLSEPDPATRRKLSKRGTLVTFYSYGNPDFKGIVVCISQKTFSDFEKLLVYANEKVPTSTGAKHIFRYPDWKEIKSVTQFEPGGHYVVASVKTVDRSTRYGISREKFWHTTNPSAGKIGKMRPSELHLYKGRDSDTSSDSPIRKTARVLKVISNLSRKSSEKLILNPHIRQSFEEWLSDMSNSLIIPRPPIKAMYSAEPPHLRVESFSQLSRDFKDHDTFIICGAEMTPIDMKKKRPAPSSNSSNDSTGREKNIKKRPLGYGSGDGADVLPNGSYSSISETPRLNVARRPNDKNLSPTRMGPPSQMMNQSRQSRDDGSIRTEIDGRLKEFFRPTYHEVEDDGTKPEKTLKLEWVYGFNGRDIRCNIVVLGKTGELVYYIAGVAVLFDKWKDLQRHYLGHNEDITCLDLHPDGIHVATGQMAGSSVQNGAHIRIWHGLSLSTIAVVGLGHLHRGVVAISFSQQSDGYYMMSVDASERHILSVWDWQKETLIARTTTSNDKVTGGTFYPLDDTILITYGKVHLHFWKLFWDPMKEQEGKILRDKKSGVFQESDTPKQITAIAFNDIGDVITGDSSGSVRVWVRDDTSAFTQEYQLASNMRHAHRKPVLCLCVLKDGTLLSGGDNEIRAWDSGNNYMEVKERIMPENAGNVAAMIPQAFGGADGALYIGTTRGCILDGSLQHKFKFVVQGHSDSVWAVTSHPEEPAFITAGHDQLVIKWSAVSHKIVWRVQVEKPCLSASIHPKGRVVALGTSAGRIIILNSANGTHHTSVQVTESQVKSTLFSPGGHMLALGCHDGSMHLFSVEEDAQLFRRIHTVPKMHASPVVHIDWSNDNRFIRVVSGDFDLAYFDIEKKQTVKNSRTMRGVKWFTHNANVSYHTLGPWSLLESADQHINVAARSQYRDLLLTGDDKGRLRLYKYPCATQKPAFRGCKAYSGDITGACFLAEDLNVVSVGENEAALLQWAVEDCRRS